MIDDTELQSAPDEPSPEDFEAAEMEATGARPRSALVRLLRLAGVLFVVVALLFYLVVPAGVFVQRAASDWLRSNNPIQSIPLAPKRMAPPTGRT